MPFASVAGARGLTNDTVAPTRIAAALASMNSGRFGSMIATLDPGPTPIDRKWLARRRTRSRSPAQVVTWFSKSIAGLFGSRVACSV
jgi:hypothetical protein